MATDAQTILKDWAADQLGNALKGALAGKQRPTNIMAVMPLLMVVQFGGSNYRGVRVAANVDVDIFAATEQGAKDLAHRLDDLLLVDEAMTNHTTPEGHVVTGVTSMSIPLERTYESRHTVHRWGAAYTLLLHPRAAA